MKGVSVPTLGLRPELLRLRALCATEEITATFRHRVLNDLSGIGAMLFTLRRRLSERHPDTDDDRDVRDLIEALDQRVLDAGQRLPERFLAAPRRDGTGVAVGSEIAHVLDIAGACTGVTLRIEDGGQTATIASEELKIAAGCLVENGVEALQATGGGALTVRCLDGEPGEMILEIADDGQGIDGPVRDQMFEPFFSTRTGHLGLGLNIARRLARRWGGDVSVTASEPRGTRARMTLLVPPSTDE